MTATVTKLKTAKPATKRQAKPAAERKPGITRATLAQRIQGSALYSLAAVTMTLSLDHLASGIASSTGQAAWQGWTLAIAVDAGFAVVESMPFTCRTETLRDTKWARLGLTGAVYAASAYFNTIAFAHGAAIGAQSAIMGLAVPAMVGTFLHLANRCMIGRSH